MKSRIILAAAFFAFISCGNSVNSQNVSNKECCNATSDSISVANVEVLYMHGKQRCATCKAIGLEAEALIKELGDGRVVMKTVDYSTADGEKIADKYEIASSSLLVVCGDKVQNLTADGFQYARNNPAQFKQRLKEAIDKMLN